MNSGLNGGAGQNWKNVTSSLRFSAQCRPVWVAAPFNEMQDNSLQTAGWGPAGVHVQYIIGFALLPRSSVYVPPVHSKHLKDGKQIYQFPAYTVDMQSQLRIVTFPQFWGQTSLRVTRVCASQITQQIHEISSIDVITV